MPLDFTACIAAVGSALSLDTDTDDDESACRCQHSFETPTGRTTDRTELVVDATDCPGGGDLAGVPACRATVIGALADRDADVVRVRADGLERTYDDDAAGVLLAAGRFAERVGFHDESLAERATRDPIDAVRRATGRAGPVATLAAETGLAAGVERADDYESLLWSYVGPSVARSRVARRLPSDAALLDRRELDTGATVRLYRTGDGRLYHLTPVAHELDADATATLAAAHECLARGIVQGGERAAGRAVRHVADDDDPVETLTDVLNRHTRGNGVLDDLFADPRVTDVVASAPVASNPVRVAIDGERIRTNVRLTPDGAAALASRFRHASGRGFSRASPALDAAIDAPNGSRVRVAGVTAPASDGIGFAFRAHDGRAWTLPGLVASGTLSAETAAFLSFAVERGATGLVAGTRGAGKTTLLGSLLWELPAATRLVTVEDTPELPVAALRDGGRDVQPLHTDLGEDGSFSPTDAVRTALRLGDGALVVGEVRGDEASALYEAMRVGAHGHAVLGTIHGDSPAAVRERVVSDLGVPESSFAATDLVVTCTRDGSDRRVETVAEVRQTDEGVHFETLYGRDGNGIQETGVVTRGDSSLVAALARHDESYADVLDALDRRTATLSHLAETDQTRPDDLPNAAADVREVRR
ncbi:ATPase, type iv secretory pathway virb11 component like protein [Halogeometricum borinquense DSM 11551]|uniref:ATPase, type IV secretory pathway VirB11 component like protein n=1 Tax=Halogeometricum borinquense (strain ATCC 700274 / DSM 11551 / JCM 10706 / KCTC 4070 / PR3) TaxID=469382 RepID=E4NRX7_HALBP|nr:type II/IV secretion system ATPase subunit [Halogeometricum borinquense]ADQ68023.1 ATPase, type IV secretory pathway VirB11 component like protein [Halogeometricum borinquense DSM 11551]ELY24056.1 ATPase, type iv secretory pathway virb11 component like protein [Halogeometricum borinquense DSM 11551]